MLTILVSLFKPSRLAALMATPQSHEHSAVKKHYDTICAMLATSVDIAWFGIQLQQECFITAEYRSTVVDSADSKWNKFAHMMDAILCQIKVDKSGSKFKSFVAILLKQGPLLGAVTLLRGM